MELTGTIPVREPASRLVGAADGTARVTVTLYVRDRAAAPPSDSVAPMTREEYAAQHGASADDLARIAQFSSHFGLEVDDVDAAARRVRLSGSTAQMDAAFGVQLQTYADATGQYRSHSGAVNLPVEIAEVVEAVLGLDTRPIARPKE